MDEKGICIYFDESDRPIVDALCAEEDLHHLYPSNLPAQKLYRCVEAMRDLLPLIEDIAQTKSAEIHLRKIKVLCTPLYSFVQCILDLMHDIQCNPDTKKGLPPKTDALVSEMEKTLDEAVPYGREKTLRTIRNRLSAHIDPDMDPLTARKLLARAGPSEIGRWLDALVSVLADLLKLPIYVWTCEGKHDNVVGLTAPGAPVITFVTLDGGHVVGIAGILLMKRDPRTEIFDLLLRLVDSSRWMFKPKDPRITGFRRDKTGEAWCQSPKTLRQLTSFSLEDGLA